MTWTTMIWTIVAILAMLLEAVTFGLVSIWFLPGALVAIVLSELSVPPLWQIVSFLVISLVLLIFARRIFRRYNRVVPTNADALIGKEIVITEEVDNIRGIGAGKVSGQMWTVRTENEQEELKAGDIAVVVGIAGNKLICKKNETA